MSQNVSSAVVVIGALRVKVQVNSYGNVQKVQPNLTFFLGKIRLSTD